jgi:hypothetical protein
MRCAPSNAPDDVSNVRRLDFVDPLVAPWADWLTADQPPELAPEVPGHFVALTLVGEAFGNEVLDDPGESPAQRKLLGLFKHNLKEDFEISPESLVKSQCSPLP